MTELLERAIAKVKALPEEEQDTIAALVLDEIEDEARWDEALPIRKVRWQDWRKRRLRRIAPGEHKSWIQMQCEVTDHGAVPQDIGETVPSQVRFLPKG